MGTPRPDPGTRLRRLEGKRLKACWAWTEKLGVERGRTSASDSAHLGPFQGGRLLCSAPAAQSLQPPWGGG